MFRFTQEPSSGNQCQCLAKITGMVPLCMSIWALSVLWRHIPICCACVSFSLQEDISDDDSCVNRNILEQFLHFKCVFSNPTIYIIECNNWIIKCFILLMHGATMKINAVYFPPLVSSVCEKAKNLILSSQTRPLEALSAKIENSYQTFIERSTSHVKRFIHDTKKCTYDIYNDSNVIRHRWSFSVSRMYNLIQ